MSSAANLEGQWAKVEQVPQGLVEQIAERNCVLFLGPDVSESASGYRGLPSSWRIADELAAKCNYRGQYRPLPRMAQIYEHRFGAHGLISYLQERLSGYEPLPIHEIIARIPFRRIVYAGWDRLLERALSNQGVAYRVAGAATDLGYLREDRLVVLKPYGSLDQPEGLAITQDRQFDVFSKSDLFMGELRHLMARHWLLMVGYAIDYDTVFVQNYYRIRQEQAEHRPLAFVVQSLRRPDDVAYWETLGIRPVFADPTRFLYDLAEQVAEAEGRPIALPDMQAISGAEPVTPADLQAYAAMVNRALDTVGVDELLEQTDVPLLSAEQARDLDVMLAAYERLAEGIGDVAEASLMLLRQGNIEYFRQNYDSAEGYYRRALEADPGLGEAYHNLHYVYLAQSNLVLAAGESDQARHKLDDALSAYQKALESKPFLALLPSHYTVEAVLGQGGMGIVYQARDTRTGQAVAIKLLKRVHMYNEKAAMRFRREATLLQRLEHEHVVRCVESQQYKGRHFIVMEYLGDQTVARLLQERGPLSLDRAHEVVQQVGKAIQAAHQQGIIHRDIKPSNIFLVDGQAKVIDFGLAVDLEAGQPSAIGVATGTVRYMSPEQQRGAPVDARTDVYALATVFYEMLTGRHPGEGTYQPINELVEGVNPSLDIVIEKARQPEPETRYRSISAFCTELAQVIPLQPGSRQAAPWRRVIARFQQIITWATQDYWLLLPLLSLIGGILVPQFLPSAMSRTASRLVALLLWDVFLLNVMTNAYTVWLSRRTGYATLAAYGPSIATVLGLSAAVMASITFSWSRIGFEANVHWIDYVVELVLHGFAAVLVAGLSFLCIVSGARVAVRLRLGSRSGILIGYGSALLILAVLAYVLYVVIHG